MSCQPSNQYYHLISKAKQLESESFSRLFYFADNLICVRNRGGVGRAPFSAPACVFPGFFQGVFGSRKWLKTQNFNAKLDVKQMTKINHFGSCQTSEIANSSPRNNVRSHTTPSYVYRNKNLEFF